MSADVRVVSVNVGARGTIELDEGRVPTGIFKLPVAGDVHVDRDGLAGDHVADTRYHGGPDQALYLYAEEDLAWWSGVLGRPVAPGTFGENLTLAGCDPAALRLGDRLHLGGVLLEVTAPRIPCEKLAVRLGEPDFARRFTAAGRPGAYARVLAGGLVHAGTNGTVEASGEPNPTVLDLAKLWPAPEKDLDLLCRCLAAPIAARARARLRSWLEERGA